MTLQFLKLRSTRYLIGLLLTATLGSFLTVRSVSAIVYQDVGTTSSGLLSGAQTFTQRQYFISNPLETPTTTITAITIRLAIQNGCHKRMIMRNTSSNTLGSSTVIPPDNQIHDYTFTFATSSNFHTGNLQSWTLDTPSPNSGPCTLTSQHTTEVFGNTSTSTYPNGYWSLNGSATPNGTLGNEYFIINGTEPPSSIDFYFPSGAPTSTCDFSLWPVEYDISSADTALYGGNIGPAVEWSNTVPRFYSDNIGCTQSTSSAYIAGTTTSTCSAPNFGVRKDAWLTPGYTYTATPYLVAPLDEYRNDFAPVVGADSDMYIAQGTTWNFIISGQPNENGCQAVNLVYPTGSWPFATTTFDNPFNVDWCEGIDESGFVGQIKSAFCQAAQYLFKPSQTVFDQFYELKATLENKPPFGYVTVYTNAIEGLETSASSTTSTLSTVTSTAGLQLSTWAGLSIVQSVRTAFSWFFYVVFAFYVFNRLRKFSLHG